MGQADSLPIYLRRTRYLGPMAWIRRRSLQLDDTHEGAVVVNGFRLLEFDRTPINRNILTGFPLGWNSKLTLVEVLDDVYFRLNGYAIFHNADVKRWRPIRADDFRGKAVKLNKLRPVAPAGVRFSSMREAVSSAGVAFPLITVHRERIRRNAFYVGKVLRTSQRATTLLPISPGAEWELEERYQLKDITLLEFGGAYEDLLFRMAGQASPE